MLCGAGGPSPALHVNGRKSSDDRPSCLENPRPAGAESTLTENVASPFQAEPRHEDGRVACPHTSITEQPVREALRSLVVAPASPPASCQSAIYAADRVTAGG